MESDNGKDQLVKSEIAQLPQWVINLQKELDNMESVSPPKAINQGPRWMHAAPDTLHDQEPDPEDFPCDTYLRHAKVFVIVAGFVFVACFILQTIFVVLRYYRR